LEIEMSQAKNLQNQEYAILVCLLNLDIRIHAFLGHMEQVGFDSNNNGILPEDIFDVVLDFLGVPEDDSENEHGFSRDYLYEKWHSVLEECAKDKDDYDGTEISINAEARRFMKWVRSEMRSLKH